MSRNLWQCTEKERKIDFSRPWLLYPSILEKKNKKKKQKNYYDKKIKQCREMILLVVIKYVIHYNLIKIEHNIYLNWNNRQKKKKKIKK